PIRGEERGSVPKMGEKFDAMLKEPPAGVQVLTACVAGQHSYEVPPTNTLDGQIDGGIMLGQISDIKQKGGLKGIIQRPEDPIPIQSLASTLKVRTGAFVRAFMKNVQGAEQEVRLTGTEAESKLVFDPKLAAAPKYSIELTDEYKGKGAASKDDIANVFKEINGIPPAKRTDAPVAINFDS